MYKDKKILAIIPARSGSKRLPNKNIKELGGKPLIAWSILSALKTDIFDEIMVNTDDQIIAGIAKEYGASIPFLRDTNLATDTASSLDVVLQTIEYYKKENQEFDIIILLQPTSPLRDSHDIINAMDTFIDNKAASVLSVCEVDHPIQWCNTLNHTLSMNNFIKAEHKDCRSQDLEVNYRLNGAIYVWDAKELILQRETILKPSFASIMNGNHSIDIDEEIDFVIAKSIMLQQVKNDTDKDV